MSKLDFDTKPSEVVKTEEVNAGEEERLLGDKSPIRTLMSLSVGPLLTQMGMSIYGLVDSMWIAKALGADGLAVLGAVFVVEFISLAVASYLNVSISARTSFLFGQKRSAEIAQVYVDFIRVAFVLGIVIPSIVIPITKPVIIWFGGHDQIARNGMFYMFPGNLGCFFNFIYQIACGILQAEGHSSLYGMIQGISLVTNMFAFDPLFLFGFKTQIWGVSMATILSQAIPGIILTVLIFRGNFVIKPTMKMFVSPFSSQTWSALRVGTSSLVASVSLTLPQILMQKYINTASLAIGKYDIVIQIWAVIEKLYQITGGICVAFSAAALPAASFAFGAARLNRLFWIAVHSLWIATLISTLLASIMVFFPKQVCSIWSSEPEFLEYAETMIPIVFYTALLTAIQYVVPAILQSMKRILASTILSILTLLIPLPLFSTILYFTGRESPVRIIWTYPLNDVYSFLICLLFMISPLKFLLKAEPSGLGEMPSESLDLEEEEDDELDEVI